ncbi:acyltransferase family protein [Aestuariivirga litoralis]|nr:acyltransferase family protein [Aestuariivirga litoralis]
MKYRPDIDGLRAVAVLAVVAFHLKRDWLPGGFVGVDVFFVISGFLITALILEAQRSGTFTFSGFYQRRIARIAPAFLLVATATLFFAWLVYTPQDFASSGAVFVAALLSVANMKFIYQGDYFAFSPDAQPFLHYWSLSVEEQYYLVFPLFLMTLLAVVPRHARTIVAGAFAASLALCIVLTYHSPQWAFFSLPSRAWELLAGSLAAMAAAPFRPGHFGRLGSGLRAAGLMLIIGSCLILDGSMAIPGFYALLPVIGAVTLVSVNPAEGDVASRLLRLPAFVLVGKLSYTLYLWHYPIFCLVDYHFYASSELFRTACKLMLTVLAVGATYLLVEAPSRRFLNRPASKRLSYAFLVTALVLLVPLGLHIRANYYINADPSDVASGGLVFEQRPSRGTVVLMGDSNGSMYGYTLREIARELGLTLVVASVASGDPLPPVGAAETTLWADSLAVIRKTRPDFVIIGMEWREKLKHHPGRLDTALAEIGPHTGKIIIMDQIPSLPPVASREGIRKGIRPPFGEDVRQAAIRQSVNRFLHAHASDKVVVIDTAAKLVGPDGDVRFADGAGRETYKDEKHISTAGAALFADDIRQALGAPPH